MSNICKYHHSRIEVLQNHSAFLKCDELASHFYGSKFLVLFSLFFPSLFRQNLDKQINSFHIQNTLADFNNVKKEFLPKKSSQKSPLKKFLPKNSSKKILSKKSPQKISTKSRKNTKKFQSNSQKFLD